MKRPAPKADLLEHTWRVYSTVHRWARGVSSGRFDTTHGQLRKACGYADDAKVLHSMQRYLALLAELGLVRTHHVRDGGGRSQRLDVELLPVPDEASAAPAVPGGPAEARPAAAAADAPVWRVRRLRRAEQRLLRDVCQGATAGRVPRRLAPRLQLFSNLRTPEGVRGLRPLPLAPALRGRAHEGRPAAGSVPTRASAELGAATADAAGGCAAAAAASESSTALGTGPGLDALMASLIGAAARRSFGLDVPELPDVAAGLVAEGADPVLVVIAAWRAVRGGRGGSLSAERRLQLDVALRRLDRYAMLGAGQQGAGVRQAVALIERDRELQRLAGVVAWLRAEARRWRRGDRVRRGLAANPTPKQLPDAAWRNPSGGDLIWPADERW